jgi:hypothetical protein
VASYSSLQQTSATQVPVCRCPPTNWLHVYYTAAEGSERRSRALSTFFRNREDQYSSVARRLLVLFEVFQDSVLLMSLFSTLIWSAWASLYKGGLCNLSLPFITPWQSRWPRGLMCKAAAALSLRSQVRIPLRAWMFVSCVCCMLCTLQPHRPADNSLGSLLPDMCVNGEADSARFGPWRHRGKKSLHHWTLDYSHS